MAMELEASLARLRKAEVLEESAAPPEVPAEET